MAFIRATNLSAEPASHRASTAAMLFADGSSSACSACHSVSCSPAATDTTDSLCRPRRSVSATSASVSVIVEDEPYMAEAIRDGLRLEAIAADIAGDGDTALELLSFNAYDIAVLDRDIPGPSGDEIADRIVASGSGTPILMLTAADRLDDKATGFELGADDYLTKPFELRELVLRLRALDRRRAHNRPPVREIAGLRVGPCRRV